MDVRKRIIRIVNSIRGYMRNDKSFDDNRAFGEIIRNQKRFDERSFSTIYMKYVLLLLGILLIVVDVFSKEISIEWVHIAIFVVILLPWTSSLIDSFSISSDRIEASFRKVEEKLDNIEETTTDIYNDNNEDYEELYSSDENKELNESKITHIDSNKKEILEAISNSSYKWRTKRGIRENSDVKSSYDFDIALEELENDRYIRSKIGRNGNRLWSVTNAGSTALSNASIKLPSSNS